MEIIVGVSVKADEDIFTLGKPQRHHDVVQDFNLVSRGYSKLEQGFMTDKGRFLTREQAYVLAQENGQFQRVPKETDYNGPKLFSEDLW